MDPRFLAEGWGLDCGCDWGCGGVIGALGVVGLGVISEGTARTFFVACSLPWGEQAGTGNCSCGDGGKEDGLAPVVGVLSHRMLAEWMK